MSERPMSPTGPVVHPDDPRPAIDGTVVWDWAVPRRSGALAAFLLARIAEVEAAARAAGNLKMWLDDLGRCWIEHPDGGRIELGDKASAELTVGYWLNHVALHMPARVLAECAAKRRIVEDATQGGDCQGHPGSYQPHGEYGPGYCRDFSDNQYLRLLALPYADHPDWREEWRP